MSQNNNKIKSLFSNPFIFIGAIALIASLVLSLTSETFKERVKANKKLDKMKNVLMCRYLENISEFESNLSDPEWILNEFDSIIEINPVVDRIFPAQEIASAHQYLESGQQFGKVILTYE